MDDGTAWKPGDADSSFGYYTTQFAYNDLGLENRVLNADGTITRTIYNAEAEVTSVWIGTNGWSETPDDAPEEGQDYWTTAHSDNMVEVAAYVYDEGGAGDGNVTESVSFQYAAAAADWHATTPTADVTLVGYDWRDRPIAEKDGAMATVSHNATTGLWDVTLAPGDEGTGADTTARPMTVDTLDNLGQPTAEYIFAANGKSLADVTDYVAAHPDAPNYDNLLRAYTTNLFDPQGRVYETDVYSVEQTGEDAGTIDETPSPETTSMSFGPRGLVDHVTDALGVTTSYVDDGAMREVEMSVPDPLADSDGSPGTRDPDHANLLTDYTLDGDGNVEPAAPDSRQSVPTAAPETNSESRRCRPRAAGDRETAAVMEQAFRHGPSGTSLGG